MKNNITRYNRTFIGLMEMCNTGNWCEYSEAEDAITKLEQNIKLKEIDIEAKSGTIKYYLDVIKEERKLNEQINNKLIWASAIIYTGFFLIIGLISLVVKYHG